MDVGHALLSVGVGERPASFDVFQKTLDPEWIQQALAASMQAAWAHFAATGNPATAAVPWPAFGAGSTRMLSLVPPQPQLETDFAARHHCTFWAAR